MAYGDVNYEIVKTASVAYATTALSQALLLTDNSLSVVFNLDDVLYLNASILGTNSFRIAPSSLSNDIGIQISSASPSHNFKPMKVRNIINLAAYNEAASANGSGLYIFWAKNP
jgi:hypothetical protein